MNVDKAIGALLAAITVTLSLAGWLVSPALGMAGISAGLTLALVVVLAFSDEDL